MMDHDLFKNVIMHQSMPNLEEFIWIAQNEGSKNPLLLPDMSGCHKLKKLILDYGIFTAPSNPFNPQPQNAIKNYNFKAGAIYDCRH